MRRLLVVILIIAAVIAFAWNKPFKDWTAQAYTNITSWFDSLAR
jgi:Tfp pilus assembly protein PilO